MLPIDSVSTHIHLIQKTAMVSSFGQTGSAKIAKAFCRIVGVTCLIVFAINFIAILLPPNPLLLEWRLGFLQQVVSDRSVLLLFGAALLTYGSSETQKLRRQLALTSVILGVVFLLSCVAVVRDSMQLNGMAVKNITTQASQVQSQIETAKSSPEGAANITPEQLKQASQLVDTKAVSLKQGAQTGVFKAGSAIVGNLVVVGIALINLGRYGMKSRKG